MNTSNISGDTMVVMGAPMPTEKTLDIPPKTAGKKVIEEGEIILNLEPNTKELVDKVNAKKGNQER